MSNSTAAVMADSNSTRVSAYPVRNMKQDIWYFIERTPNSIIYHNFVREILTGVNCERNRYEAVCKMIEHIEKQDSDDDVIESLSVLCGFYFRIEEAACLTVAVEHEIKNYLDLIS